MSPSEPYPQDGQWVLLDERHAVHPYTYGPFGTAVVGVMEAHRTADGEWCNSALVPFDTHPQAGDGRTCWHVESQDPLTLTPSIVCRRCGEHGWIRNGAWVPA